MASRPAGGDARRRDPLANFFGGAQASAMSASTSSGAPRFAPENPVFNAFSAAMQAHFAAATAGAAGEVHLFETDTPDLYGLWLEGLSAADRDEHRCQACRRFLQRFGGLVRVTPEGATVPVMWSPEGVPELYLGAVKLLAATVSQAPISGVFLSAEQAWGQAKTGEWSHLAVAPGEGCVHRPSPVKSTGQEMAELRQDHAILLRGLEEFPLELVINAHSLLTSGALFRSEKCIGVAKWLMELHERRAAEKNRRLRDNLTWLAVAGAPAGFCHVRSTMIGTLLEDLAAGMDFEAVKARFDAKMHPLQYQRPTAPPSAGNIAQAEKIVATLKSAGALERRFARLADIEALWLPRAREPRGGPRTGEVFGHLKPEETSRRTQVEAPPVTMTWEKFARTVLPEAEAIEYWVPKTNQLYLAMVTAKNPEAPPILQWDLESKRNPLSWYVYVNGSAPANWGLKAETYHPVSAVTLQPTMWGGGKGFAHQGEKVFFLLKDAKDLEYKASGGFFPEFLKSEYHPIRATLEAYAKTAVIEGKGEAEACGLCLTKGSSWDHRLRVTARGGMRTTYKLDRWD